MGWARDWRQRRQRTPGRHRQEAIRTPEQIANVPAAERTDDELFRYGTHGPFARPLPEIRFVPKHVTGFWPGAPERVLRAEHLEEPDAETDRSDGIWRV